VVLAAWISLVHRLFTPFVKSSVEPPAVMREPGLRTGPRAGQRASQRVGTGGCMEAFNDPVLTELVGRAAHETVT
jgi:hypothetical protein